MYFRRSPGQQCLLVRGDLHPTRLCHVAVQLDVWRGESDYVIVQHRTTNHGLMHSKRVTA